MSSFTQKLGARWERINENDYFHEGSKDDMLQKEVMMTTSHQYEEAYIQLMTMRYIKNVQTSQMKCCFLFSEKYGSIRRDK